MKEIETSKGKWKVVEINTYQEGQYYVDTIGRNYYKLSKITEEELYNETEITYSMLHFKGIEITQNTYIF